MSQNKGMRKYWDERARRIVEMREQNISWSKIAEAMNISTQGAKMAFKTWRRRQAQEAAE